MNPIPFPRRETRAFLRINDYYLLFADPVIPFVGRSGHLMVPACTVAPLLGMWGHFDAAAGRVLLDGSVKQSLTFTAGVPVAAGDRGPIPLAEPPVRLPPSSGVHDLLVPITALAAIAQDAGSRWNAPTRTLTLSGSKLLPQTAGFCEQIGYTARGYATDDLAPVAIEIKPGHDAARRPCWLAVFTLRNISGTEIPTGGAWIKSIDFTQFTGVACGGVPYNSPDVHTPPPAAIPAGHTITTSIPIGSGYSPGQLRIIVAQPQRAGDAPTKAARPQRRRSAVIAENSSPRQTAKAGYPRSGCIAFLSDRIFTCRFFCGHGLPAGQIGRVSTRPNFLWLIAAP